jgi:hypothetical protein
MTNKRLQTWLFEQALQTGQAQSDARSLAALKRDGAVEVWVLINIDNIF